MTRTVPLTRLRRTFGAALVPVVALVAAGCTVDPQRAETARLSRLGYELVDGEPAPGGARAMIYEGEVSGLVTCRQDGEPVRIEDASFASERLPGRTIVQNSTLDSLAIVDADGSTDAFYILTVVREVREAGRVLGRDIETVSFETGGTARLWRQATCQER